MSTFMKTFEGGMKIFAWNPVTKLLNLFAESEIHVYESKSRNDQRNVKCYKWTRSVSSYIKYQ